MAEKSKTTNKASAKKVSSDKSVSTAAEVQPQKEKFQPKNLKVIALAVLILILIIIIIFLFKGLFVAATVNGEPITRIAVVKSLEKQSGKMALENLITKKLILQEAKKRNISITQTDIDNEIKKISESLKKQNTTLEAALEAQGMTKAELNNELKVQLALQKMTEKDIKVTDKDIQDFITANKSQFAEATTETQMKEIAKAQLIQQKSAEKSQSLVEALQKQAKINHFVNY